MNCYTPRDFEHYVGIPWQDGGRGRDGVDCWGLVRLVYQEVLGIALPSHSEDYTTALDRITIRRLIDGKPDYWVRVESPVAGDGALMMNVGRPHMGVVIGGGWLLHIERGGGSVIENYNSLAMASRLEGFYRYAP